MRSAHIPPHDAARVESLRGLKVLDTSPEERFDRLTRLARRLFDVPIALVSFVDEDRQWFKSRVGLDAQETPREVSFCAHAILDEHIMVIPDAGLDDRFKDNPLVTGTPNIRFYAGRPIQAPDGATVGTLCIIDNEPRQLSDDDRQLLNDLGSLLEEELRTLRLVTTDELTGITNRRGFRIIASHTLALCERVSRPATLVLMDLDGFKEINDTLGHAAGDQALKTFSRHLLDSFRDSDVVARLGGDEFCVLLSGTDEPAAGRALQNLKERLAARTVEEMDAPVIRFSAGAVRFDPERHATVEDLLHEADLHMYDQKRKGD